MARRLWLFWVWYRSPVVVRPDNQLLPLPMTFQAARCSSPLP